MRPLLLLGVAAVLAGCASTPADRGPLSAEAVLKDKEGKQVGVATMIQLPMFHQFKPCGRAKRPRPVSGLVAEVRTAA